MVKKLFRLLNRSIKMSELGLRPAQLTILSHDEAETDAKKWSSRNSASDHTNPLEMVKKTFQTFESLTSVVRARS